MKKTRLEEIDDEITKLMRINPDVKTKENNQKLIDLTLEGVLIRVSKGLKKR